jgi:hypothetical protein
LHTSFHATLNDLVLTDNRNQRRADVQPPTDSESHSNVLVITNPHNPVLILRSNSPKWSAVDTGWNISDAPGETINSTTLHPLTPPYKIGRELARSRYVHVNSCQRYAATLRFRGITAKWIFQHLGFPGIRGIEGIARLEQRYPNLHLLISIVATLITRATATADWGWRGGG